MRLTPGNTKPLSKPAPIFFGDNKPVDFSKFKGGDYRPDSTTYISEAIFKDKTKKIKKVGGKYHV